MRASSVAPESLSSLLPRDLISQALCDEEEDSELEEARQQATSPMGAPVESRLHRYKQSMCPSTPVRLHPLLQSFDLVSEVAAVVQSLTEAQLFPQLVASGFYTEAAAHISDFRLNRRCLRAEASVFEPADKENVPNSC